MKTFKIAFLFILLCTANAFAQYGNSYGGGGYRNNNMPRTEDSKPSPERLEKEKNERIEIALSRLKEDLELDELQVIAVRNEIVSSNKEIDILTKSQIPEEDKSKQFVAIQEKVDKNIMSYLNPKQKEKYTQLKLEKGMKKEDKKRKKKDDKEDKEKTED